VNSAIEFHDSVFQELRKEGASIQVVIDGYVFKSEGIPAVDLSTGWNQTTLFRLSDASFEGKPPGKGMWIGNGSLVLEGKPHNDLLPLPFEHSGKTELNLEFIDGTSLRVRGSSVKAVLTGEATFIEDIPWTKAK